MVGTGHGAESTATMAGGADSSSSAAKRAKVEAANRDELLRKLPAELWSKIVDENVQQNDLLALAMTCRFFREKQKDLGKKLETNLGGGDFYRFLDLQESGKVTSYTLGWFRWVCDNWKFLPGYEWSYRSWERVKGRLVNYAALQGSVEILRWLIEEKGCKPVWETCEWAGMGGSVEILEYLLGKGCEFDLRACHGAASGGCLEALKFLRGLDPPCPWDGELCAVAAKGGHLEILKFARGQDPPCPWDRRTCTWAAEGGHLEVLKWLRDQDPPCPWDWETCAWAAHGGQLEVLNWARDQDPPCPWGTGGDTCAFAALGGHLEVLKWLRAQNPPCPWSRIDCRAEASMHGHEHIVDWIDQQEDGSDVEPFDEDSFYDE